MADSQTNEVPGSGGTWGPDVLNFAVRELRREFAGIPAERIVRAVDAAARWVSPDNGRVRLLQKAPEVLRRES